MKLPLNTVLSPMLRRYFGRIRIFCSHSAFSMCIFYTYLYGILGFFVSANYLRKHMGEPISVVKKNPCSFDCDDPMVLHDLKIIAASMGLVQYSCLVLGCLTENPCLFLPHLFGQLVAVVVKILNVLLLLASVNRQTFLKLTYKLPAIMLLTFNWLQVFCVFRRSLRICDL